MSGLAGMDVLKSQLKSGDMEMTTIIIAVDDSGVNLEGDERGQKHDEPDKQCYDDTAKLKKSCNKGTQTVFF